MVVIFWRFYPFDQHSSNEDLLWMADARVFMHIL
ncbi:MAG: hypothetical protein RIQ55_1291 [Pseudomonadota bacterium]|jgi:hypothetical protein